jgi:acetolactate synthase-1/2/3 large subunit
VSVRAAARSRLRTYIGPQVALLDTLISTSTTNVVVKDSTIPAYTWGNRLLTVHRPRTSISPNGFAIGLGLPQAIGAGVGVASKGDTSRVVLLVGDGGFMLAATELATLAEYSIPVTVVVFVDGGYGILRNIQDVQYGSEGRFGVEASAPDFVGLAKALGVAGRRVSSAEEFDGAMAEAEGMREPFLIEVDCAGIGSMSEQFIGSSRPPADAVLR